MTIAERITLFRRKEDPWRKARTKQISKERRHVHNLIRPRLSELPVVKNRENSITGSLTGSDLELLKEAIEDKIISYKQAAGLDLDNAELHFKLGFFHLFLKNRHSAMEEYRILKDLFPSMADELLRKWNIKSPF